MPRNIKIDGLLTKGKAMILACDQGFEHGPGDFNATNIDMEYVMDLALEGHYSAIAIQAGMAKAYYGLHYKDVPLIVKLNAKAGLPDPDPWSRQHTSVAYAAKLGAAAVGYTLYHGSRNENPQFVELGRIVEEAHEYGLPVVVWNYPRGSLVKDELGTDEIAYGARIAQELGADMIKLKYNGDKEGFKWILKCAGRAKVVISGGKREDERHFLQKLWEVMDAGAAGIAVGRNAWQHPKPFAFTRAMKDVIFEGKSADEAMKRLQGQ
ncbi:fructose-bisphosphate aldolase [Candidatus Woesearchaeota archaeon]|nr:fructose-bisphosphate aldolase [Candidatus Woesearchaeota archaeon]